MMITAIDLYVIEKVKEKRKACKLAQEALSIALNYSEGYINKFETGKKKYNIFHLNEIAKVLKCSPKDFLPEEPIKL